MEIRPLEINFEQELFKEKSNHANFIGMLSLLEDSSVSVLHGNPYIHLSIMDYIDGSSYDLWVVDSKQILLVPQLNSTIASLKRIVNHIYDYYAEGRNPKSRIQQINEYSSAGKKLTIITTPFLQ